MRDQHERTPFELRGEPRFEEFFGAVVHCAARLVEHENGRCEQLGARDRNRLPLAARQCFASFANGQVESIRQTVDEVGYPRNPRRTEYGGVVRARCA